MECNITHGERLGDVETKNVYHKRNQSTLDIYVIKNPLANAREAADNKADRTINADNVKLGLD